MKVDDQRSAALSHIAKLIDGIPIAMLATVEDSGAISSRPMAVLEVDGDGAFWFFTDRHSPKVEQLASASLSFADTARGTYVSLSGHGKIDNDRGRIHQLWTPFAKPWFPDGPESPNLALLRFTPDTADYWDSPNSKMVRLFGALASVVAGKPVAMGEHGSFDHLSDGAAGTGVKS